MSVVATSEFEVVEIDPDVLAAMDAAAEDAQRRLNEALEREHEAIALAAEDTP